jgi:hypothetical protein
VAVCGSLGLVDALKDFSYFFIERRMLPANQLSAYVPGNPDELINMVQCMSAARRLGQQMVALVKMNFRYPEEFIERHGAYGTNRK